MMRCRDLTRAFADGGKLLHEWSGNIAEISRPAASLDIANLMTRDNCEVLAVFRRLGMTERCRKFRRQAALRYSDTKNFAMSREAAGRLISAMLPDHSCSNLPPSGEGAGEGRDHLIIV